MGHPGFVSVQGGWDFWGPKWVMRSLKGRKNRRAARRRARRFGYALRAATARGGVKAFVTLALDTMHASAEERAMFPKVEG